MSKDLLLLFVILSVMSFIWLGASHLETRQTLRWWSKMQIAQLWHESDRIHNGVLQKVFTVRRELELSMLNEPEVLSGKHRDWLTQIEQIHSSLEALSSRLSPPYLEESLPLAIQAMLQSWTVRYPLTLKTELPLQWINESPEHNQTLLRLLNEVLRLSLIEKLSLEVLKNTVLWVDLSSIDCHAKLTVRITYPNAKIAGAIESTLFNREKRYLNRTFECLNSGKIFYYKNDIITQWCFRWKLPKNEIDEGK